MIGQQDNQLKMVVLDLSSMVSENHLLRMIKKHIDFDFIYDRIKDRYSTKQRRSYLFLIVRIILDLIVDLPKLSTVSDL
jgi:transposase